MKVILLSFFITLLVLSDNQYLADFENTIPVTKRLIVPEKNSDIKDWNEMVFVHIMDTDEELQAEFEATYPGSSFKVRGFMKRQEDGTCHIYFLRPEHVNDDKTRTVGHELLHCIYNRYHGF